MTALTELLAKVEAGEAINGYFQAVFGLTTNAVNAIGAYHGSLDCARALHGVVLPGWKWSIHEPRPGVVRVSVIEQSPLRPMPSTSENSDPARAWLIAILRAFIAKEAGE
jgi:hypothetical protein